MEANRGDRAGHPKTRQASILMEMQKVVIPAYAGIQGFFNALK